MCQCVFVGIRRCLQQCPHAAFSHSCRGESSTCLTFSLTWRQIPVLTLFYRYCFQGSTCDVRVKNGTVYEGIFKTLSSQVKTSLKTLKLKLKRYPLGRFCDFSACTVSTPSVSWLWMLFISAVMEMEEEEVRKEGEKTNLLCPELRISLTPWSSAQLI